MKNVIILTAIILCLGHTLKAQYSVDRYKYNHQEYDYRADDKYVPAIAGIASYLIPGLGHVYCNESERGFKFMAAYGGAVLVAIIGGVTFIYNHDLRNNDNPTGEIILAAGCLSAWGIQIWSCIDAVRVSKINNLALRDRKTHGYSIRIQPYLRNNANIGFSTGLSLCFQVE